MQLVILVNENSASSSEILTGALRDRANATVVGKKTYGKGIVQSVVPLSDGSGMQITVAQYYTPNGYAVYDVEGAAITDWRYKSSLHDESFQIRLHRGGDTHSGFTYPYTPKTVIANVWNADPEWRVTLCENGVETKAMRGRWGTMWACWGAATTTSRPASTCTWLSRTTSGPH